MSKFNKILEQAYSTLDEQMPPAFGASKPEEKEKEGDGDLGDQEETDVRNAAARGEPESAVIVKKLDAKLDKAKQDANKKVSG